MAIMANYCFYLFIWMSRNSNQNPFDEILSLSFDLKPLKMNINVLDMNQFYKGLSKGLI